MYFRALVSFVFFDAFRLHEFQFDEFQFDALQMHNGRGCPHPSIPLPLVRSFVHESFS